LGLAFYVFDGKGDDGRSVTVGCSGELAFFSLAIGRLVKGEKGSFSMAAGTAALSCLFATVERSSLIRSSGGLSCHGLKESFFVRKDTVTSQVILSRVEKEVA